MNIQQLAPISVFCLVAGIITGTFVFIQKRLKHMGNGRSQSSGPSHAGVGVQQ